MNSQLALALPASASSNTVVINERCTLRTEQDQRVILVAGLPVHHYRADDAVAEAYAMVLLVDSGFAQQTEVARAFARSERTVRRHQERYAQGGMAGLGRGAGWRRGRRRVCGKRLDCIEMLRSQGLSNRAIAQRLGVNEKAIRKLVGPSKGEQVEQLALVTIPSAAVSAPSQVQAVSAQPIEKPADEQCADQPQVPSANDPTVNAANDSAVIEQHAEDSEPVPMSLDHDASDRTFDRQLAYLGMLDDAAPMFRDGLQVPGAGVLLALPCLLEGGLLQISPKLYGGIGPAFYGLRTTVLTLLLMALLRIQRPEALRERDPAAFGRLLGLDRAPEVKTLR
ncbi:MAG: helix-turn-helix domain-containing protein, partial [Steroidobacteraceae bacterium]